MKLVLIFILSMTMSPIWPIGPNPIVGDPFIIINKETNQLAFINDGEIIGLFSIATGVSSELTPEGEFTIIIKAVNPYYRRKNIPGGSPDNPLGTRWMGFDAEGTDGRIYGIHGTNNEKSIGNYVTNGCVRMHNAEVESLFTQVPIGTKVLIVKTHESFDNIAKKKGALSY
ncbi:L,D-transpeptidase [Bacillus timonensis]|nr:L,D-transpeptidase [Bacillus timonensis]